jgi:hypothetical protein
VLPDASPQEHTFIGRFSVSPGGVELAAVAQVRSTRVTGGTPPVENRPRLWLAGGDLHGEFELAGRFGLRVWAEALYGTSILDREPTDASKVNFASARALGAFRVGGLKKGAGYIEFFGTGGFLEPDRGGTREDIYWELMGGVVMGHWKQTRLTLQGEYGRAGRNFNISRQYGVGLEQVDDVLTHSAVVLEVGAAF